jgi:predicted RNA-binding protein
MCENNIKRNCVEIYYDYVAWNYLTQEKAVRRALIDSDSEVSGSVKGEGETFLNG